MDDQEMQTAAPHTLEHEVSEQPLADLQYHLIWATRRRRPFLNGPVLDRAVELLAEAAEEIGARVRRISSGGDYIVVTVESPSDLAPALIVARLKRHSASVLRREFPELRTLPSIWTRRFLATTRNDFPEERIRTFVEEQPRNERRRFNARRPEAEASPGRPVEVVRIGHGAGHDR